jgi:alcohol dehydrogenase (cytochrome c)
VTGPRWAAALSLAALAACAQLNFLKAPAVPRPRGDSKVETGPGPPIGQLPAHPDPARDWGGYNAGYEGTRFSPLDEITPANAGSLRPVCRFPIGERTPMESGPVVVDGIAFVTTASSTYAFDAATCALRWKYAYHYSPKPPFDLKVNRGVAYLEGRVFRGTNDGRVLALDARSGAELWNVVAADPTIGETFPAAPVAWNGMVFIGNAGGDNFGVVGRMMAFDARTGGRLWSTPLVASSGAAARTWPPEVEQFPRAGGATWTSYAVDTSAGLVYVPTGNAAPDFLPGVREGANLYTYAVVALDARSGAVRRVYQLLDGDFHDWDVAAAPVLVRSGERTLIVEAGKDGYVYGIDARSGGFRFKTPVTTIANATAPLTPEGTRFCPGVNGGTEWNGPAVLAAAGLAFVPATDWCTTVKIEAASKVRGKTGIPWTGSAELRHPFGTPDSAWRGWLTAVRLDDGAVAWRYASPTPLVAGVTVTQGGVVFTGDLAGAFLALDARDGRVLYRFDTGQPIGGGVATYAVGARQYVAVAGGLHAPMTWRLESSPATVTVFAAEGGAPSHRGAGPTGTAVAGARRYLHGIQRLGGRL